jgi:hypothetical protein
MRNLNKPPRYNVASIQAQQTLGGDVMQSHEQGDYVEFRDYQWLLTEKQRLDVEVERLTELNSSLDRRYDAACGAINGSTNYIGQLYEDIERLTKAGDKMLSEWCSGDEKDAKNFLKALAIWHAAKEGKQS